MEFPRRTFDGEGVEADVDFGPTLMLNRNRCILCTRCIRFMRDIDGDAQIGVTDRGAGSEISTYKEEGVHSLLSGNLMDVCPVGAITTRDYRFKSRPWDNPLAGDTICTFCSKGCNTTVWIKAKPEWARGAQMARVTPRFNPEVNSYWMCDIGRFDYHWVEGDRRLVQPLVTRVERRAAARQLARRVARASRAGRRRDETDFTFLTSAHASLEELHVLKQLAKGLGAPISVGYTVTEKKQPEGAKFKVPAANAPNVNGARDLGLKVPADNATPPDLSELRRAVEGGQVKALYVFDPGPPGSLGDVSWIVAARESGRLPLLIVHGVVHSELTAAADCVLSGSTSFEKDASYTNDQGKVQGAATVIAAPGDAQDDCLILANFAMLRRADRLDTRARAHRDCRRAHPPAGLRRAAADDVQPSGPGAHLAADVEPVRALEVGFPVPGFAAGQRRARSERAASGARIEAGRGRASGCDQTEAHRIMQEVTLLAAFVAGILSFISPCVLPLIPGYLSFVSGVTLDEMRGTGAGGGARACRYEAAEPSSCRSPSCSASRWSLSRSAHRPRPSARC